MICMHSTAAISKKFPREALALPLATSPASYEPIAAE
jgi:hypothetical protein